MEKSVSSALNKLERNKNKHDRISKILVDVKAGIEHLYENLEGIDLNLQRINHVSDDTLMETLSQSEQKLLHLYSTVKMNKDVKEILQERQTTVTQTEDVQKALLNMKSTPLIRII